MTKRCRAAVALTAMAVAACDTPTRPVDRQLHTIRSDTTIVAEYAGVTETLYLNKRILVAGDTLWTRAMLVNHSPRPVHAISWCELGVATTLQKPWHCPLMLQISIVTIAPGDSIGGGGYWVVSSPPGYYSFEVDQSTDVPVIASIVLQVDRS